MDNSLRFENLQPSELKKVINWKRNTECFCKQGKKYKKCCLPRFEAWQRQEEKRKKTLSASIADRVISNILSGKSLMKPIETKGE